MLRYAKSSIQQTLSCTAARAQVSALLLTPHKPAPLMPPPPHNLLLLPTCAASTCATFNETGGRCTYLLMRRNLFQGQGPMHKVRCCCCCCCHQHPEVEKPTQRSRMKLAALQQHSSAAIKSILQAAHKLTPASDTVSALICTLLCGCF